MLMLMLMTLCHTANGRNVVDNDMYISEDSLPTTYKLRLQRYMYHENLTPHDAIEWP